jgi:hypothetical protein
MEIDNLYDEPFVVPVWAHAYGERHRVHVFRNEKKWRILIRFKPYRELDAVSEGFDNLYRNFGFHYVSRVEVQLFDREYPSPHTNWDEILVACKSCIQDNTRRISAIRARNTIAKKRADAMRNPPDLTGAFIGVGETMAQTRARQAAGEPLRNAEGRTMQEFFEVLAQVPAIAPE